MSARMRSALAAAVLASGCAAPPLPRPPGIDHPANAGAAEGPTVPPTSTLAIDADPAQPVAPPPDEASGPQRVVPGGVQPATSSMGGMGGMDGMPGGTAASAGRRSPTTRPNAPVEGSR